LAKDVNLAILTAPAAITTGIVGVMVNTEGGFYAIVRVVVGAIITTTSALLDIEVSIDNGSTYKKVGSFPVLASAQTLLGNVARVCYIPKVSAAMLLTATPWTKVRLYATVVTTGSCTINRVDVEPLVSLAAPAVDSDSGTGLEKLW
jgi:hypothetical protein